MIGYASQLLAVSACYGLFALWTLAGWVLLSRMQVAPFFRPVVLIAVALLAPIGLAQFLTALFWISPGIDPAMCILAAGAVPLLVVATHARLFIYNLRLLANSRSFVLRRVISHWTIAGAFLCIPLAPLVFQLIFLPLHGNDPLEYMQLGRMLAEHRDAKLYPLLTALPDSGFVAPWTHPPTYGVLIALAFMLQGSTVIAGAAKLVGLWFAVGGSILCGALVYAADKRLSWRVWLTPVLVLSIPIFFELVQNAHIDALRIAAFTAAIALACHWLAAGTFGAAVLAGLSLAGALLTHSIGLLAPAIVVPLVIACWTGRPRQLAMTMIAAISVALVLGAPHYLRNVAIFGSPIQDHVEIWDIPALKVKEFLQVSRGLETMLDRFVLGALMPWTRTELFGWLPSLALLLLLVLAIGAVARGGLSLFALFAARGSSVAIQLSAAVLGFLALIVLSVLAGSELAVKNARYILTIMPIVTLVTLILAGFFVDDERIGAMLQRFGYRLLGIVSKRFVPARYKALHDRASAETGALDKWHFSLSHVATILVFIAVSWACVSQLQAASRASLGYTRSYVGSFGELFTRLMESEQVKRAGSSLDDNIVERFVVSHVPSSEKVLLFRQASYGFYHSRRFVFHIDSTASELFRKETGKALHVDLLSRNLRWIVTPDFALPEINNSAFSALLNDPALVRPLIRSRGWTLYMLRDGQSAPAVEHLAAVKRYGQATDYIYGTTEQGTGLVDGQRASVRIDTGGGFAELTRRRGAVKELTRWDTILNRPLRLGKSPQDLNVADWHFRNNDPVQVSARLSGRGLAELVVETDVKLPLFELSDTSSRSDDLHMRQLLVREVIWRGALQETPQNVGGWLVLPPSRLPDGTDGQARGARILFRLQDGSQLRVHEWSARSVSYPEQQATSQVIDSVLANGWSFTSGNLHPLHGVDLRLQDSSQVAIPGRGYRSVGVNRPSTRPVSIKAPSFWMPDDQPEKIAKLREELEAYRSAAALKLRINATLSGSGRVDVQILVSCPTPIQKDRTLIQTVLGTGATDNDTLYRIDLPPLYLWDETQDLNRLEPLPCVPSRVQFVATSRDEATLTMEEFLKNPDKARTGYVAVQNLQAAMIAGLSSATRRTLPLRSGLATAP